MKCGRITGLFDSYIKGTATREEQAILENHIATCEACRKQLELYRYYFSDTAIEDDFSVPARLNASIQYAIHQERSKKKIPFWQNRRIISAATACAFALVAGIWGISNYQNLKDMTQTLKQETVQPIPTEPATGVDEPESDSGSQPAPRKMVPDTPAPANITADATTEDAQIAAYSEEASAPVHHAYTMGRTLLQPIMQTPQEIVIADTWMENLLAQFPNEIISEDIYLVTVTKAELEEFLGCSTDANEEAEQLVIRFVSIEE